MTYRERATHDPGLPLNTVIRTPDERYGTICYNGLDGVGGIWGNYKLSPTFLPQPDFMLRDPYPNPTAECIGEDVEIVEMGGRHG